MARRPLLAVTWSIISLLSMLLGDPGEVRAASQGDSNLRFLREGREVRVLDRAAIESGCAIQTVTVDDPYYGRRKRFRACPIADVLALGFGGTGAELASDDVLLRARDGYVRPTTGARLLEPGGFLALADADRAQGDDPGFEPIDRRQVDPGPYYLVWSMPGQADAHRYPWPYQLVEIEVAALDRQFPHVAPRTAPKGSAAQAGFRIFKSECLACHAMNGEGGKVGPDLNVPRSIVEYRPATQIKEYIRDPASFRYTTMPSHKHLSDEQLDQLVAYFEVMRTLKHDPGRSS
jgi:mono/diheme cytochrome c family protein